MYSLKSPDLQLKINRNQFKDYIDSTNIFVLKYAMPLFVDVVRYDTISNRVRLNFSLSVPYTDLGFSETVDIDLAKSLFSSESDVRNNKIFWSVKER